MAKFRKNAATLTKIEAVKLADAVEFLAMQLQESFPCQHCCASGESDNVGRDHMPIPCEECWGRGWTITEEEDDE